MSFDFPNTPAEGSTYSPAGGPQYIFQNGVWKQVSGGQSPVLTAQSRNRIVNGAFQISQENGGTAVTVWGSYPADQWTMVWGIITGAQAIRAGSGPYAYAQSFSTVTASPAAGAYCQNIQYIEGIRVADFLWGTADAKPAVLRFTASSGIPGLYPVAIHNADSTRSFIKGVNLTTTKQTFVIPIPPMTTGVWPTGAVAGMSVRISSVAGSSYHGVEGWQNNSSFGLPGMVNGASVANQGINLSDVGLYLDPDNTGKAPSWQMPDEAEELRACQRYWEKSYKIGTKPGTNGGGNDGVSESGFFPVGAGILYQRFSERKRANPAMTVYAAAGTTGSITIFVPGVTEAVPTAVDNISDIAFKVYHVASGLNRMQCHWVANARM